MLAEVHKYKHNGQFGIVSIERGNSIPPSIHYHLSNWSMLTSIMGITSYRLFLDDFRNGPQMERLAYVLHAYKILFSCTLTHIPDTYKFNYTVEHGLSDNSG